MKRLADKLLTPSMVSAVMCWCMALYFKLVPIDLVSPKPLIRGLSMGNNVVTGQFFLNILYFLAFAFTVLTIVCIYYIVKHSDSN